MKVSLQYHVVAFLFLLCSSANLSSKIIMWDLGNVLFRLSTSRLAWHIGPFNCLGRSHAEMRRVLKDVFDHARKDEIKNCLVPDDKGYYLANVLCDYQAGIHPSHKLLDEVLASIEHLASEDYFMSKHQRRFTEKIVRAMFDPPLTAHVVRPVKPGVKLLKECATQIDAQGKPAHRMVVLSNWDKESFGPFKNKYPQVFSHFQNEDIIISASFGHAHGLKPSPWLFNHLLETYQIPASEFILIDDQQCNIKAAKACGMQAILVENKDFKKVRKELQKLGAL